MEGAKFPKVAALAFSNALTALTLLHIPWERWLIEQTEAGVQTAELTAGAVIVGGILLNLILLVAMGRAARLSSWLLLTAGYVGAYMLLFDPRYRRLVSDPPNSLQQSLPGLRDHPVESLLLAFGVIATASALAVLLTSDKRTPPPPA